MDTYNYRVYGFKVENGYSLIKKTNSYKQALSYTNKTEYDKVMIIRHNIDLNMDEPLILCNPRSKVRTRKR